MVNFTDFDKRRVFCICGNTGDFCEDDFFGTISISRHRVCHHIIIFGGRGATALPLKLSNCQKTKKNRTYSLFTIHYSLILVSCLSPYQCFVVDGWGDFCVRCVGWGIFIRENGVMWRDFINGVSFLWKKGKFYRFW